MSVPPNQNDKSNTQDEGIKKRVRRLNLLKLKWDADNLEKSLQSTYDYTITEVESDIGWYGRNIKWKRNPARWLRIAAIVFGGIGTIWPILVQLITFGGALDTFNNAIWATVFLSIGAGCIAFDRYMGFSTAWMRFISTEMALEAKLDKFEYEWEIERLKWAGKAPTSDQVREMVTRCAIFRGEVARIVEAETDVWIQEFQSALKSLDDTLKAQREQQRLGAVTVRVDNGDQYPEGWTLFLNGKRQDVYRGNSAAVTNLFPDFYRVRVEVTHNGQPVQAESIVTILPGEAASIDLSLPDNATA